ncbi:hypothetical protein LTS18_009877 [Coniosporium uncinatum]|uniref:Uncharacterized protein n=1 Tax=Coniosporium uncinatum TaxID=93489 RepID=A0ACC3D017_9PEZI|nr:hypothetical protein LTS18_009877 [Coniosporium uncinatum]
MQSAAFNVAIEIAKEALAKGSKDRVREVIDECRELYLCITAKEVEAAKTDNTGMALKRMRQVVHLWRRPLWRVQTRLDEEVERWEDYRIKEEAGERNIYDDGHWHDGYASSDYDVSDWWAK